MNPLRVLLFVFIAISTPGQSNADSCSDILNDGVRDTYSSDSYDSLVEKLKTMTNLTWDEAKTKLQKGSGGGNLDIVGILKLGGSGESQSDQWESLKAKLIAQDTSFLNSVSSKKVVIETANDSIVKAWSDCMAGKPVVYYYTGDPAKEVLVLVRFKGGNATKDTLKILNVTASGLEQKRSFWEWMTGRTGIRPGQVMKLNTDYVAVFKRKDPNQVGIVQLSIDGANVDPIRIPVQKDDRVEGIRKELVQIPATTTVIGFGPNEGKDNVIGGSEKAAYSFTGQLKIDSQNRLVLEYTHGVFETKAGLNRAADLTGWSKKDTIVIASYPKSLRISLVPGKYVNELPVQTLKMPILMQAGSQKFGRQTVLSLADNTPLLSGMQRYYFDPQLVNQCQAATTSNEVVDLWDLEWQHQYGAGHKHDGLYFTPKGATITLKPIDLEITSKNYQSSLAEN